MIKLPLHDHLVLVVCLGDCECLVQGKKTVIS